MASRQRLTAAVSLVVALTLAETAMGNQGVQGVRAQLGVVAEASGSGCVSTTHSIVTDAAEAVTFEPAIGDEVGAFESLVVTDTRIADGRATWTIQPTAEECSLHADDPSWRWWSEERSWGITFDQRSYLLRATRRSGMTSIGGLRVDRHTRKGAPTIRKARRQFGRPSSLKRRYGVGCRARWDRIGLMIEFVNLGGRNPCRAGLVQWGRVRATSEPTWTAVVADDVGIAAGTTDDFMDHNDIGSPGETEESWALAEIFIPFGDAGYYPSLAALLSQRGAVKGYEFWVGAGGE